MRHPMTNHDRPQQHQIQLHPQHHYEGGVKCFLPQKGPSAGQILAIIILLHVGGSLLGHAGITLVETLVGFAVGIPPFLICSPVLVPVAILIAGAATRFLSSGPSGISSFSWVFNSFRKVTGQEPLEYIKQRVQEGIIQVGEKTKQTGEMMGENTKQTGEAIKTKRQEGGAAGEKLVLLGVDIKILHA